MTRDSKHDFFGGGRRGYHHGRLKDALVDAARSLVAQHGPAGFTLAEAAKLVGVTAAAPYRHFSDRNALMGELARRGFELFGDRLRQAWDGGRPDPAIAFPRLGAAYLDFARREPGLYGAMFDNVGALNTLASGAAADAALELLRDAAAALLSRPVSPDVIRRLALEIWAMSHGVATLAIAGHLNAAHHGCDPAVILDGAVRRLVQEAMRTEAVA